MRTLLLLLIAGVCHAQTPAAPPLADVLPAETLAHLEFSGGEAFNKALAGIHVGKLLEDPEVVELHKEIVAMTARDWATFEARLGFKVRDLFALFSGEVTLTLTGLSASKNPVLDRMMLTATGGLPQWRRAREMVWTQVKQGYPRARRRAMSLRQCEVESLQVGPVTVSTAFYRGRYFISTDASALADTVRRLEKQAKGEDLGETLGAREDYKRLKREATGGHPGAFLFVDLAGLADEVFVGPLASQRAKLKPSGLDQLTAAAAGVVVTERGFSERIVVEAPGANRGIFALLNGFPRSDQKLIELAPAKSVFAISAAIEPVELLVAYRDVLAATDPKQYKDYERGLASLEKALAEPLAPLLAQVGPRSLFYASMPRFEGLTPDIVWLIEARKPAQLRQTLDRLIARGTRSGNEARALDVRKVPFAGTHFQYLNLSRLGEQQAIAPAFAMRDRWLVIGSSPAAFKAGWRHLDRLAAGKAERLVDTPRWKTFAAELDPRWGGLVYLDGGRLLTATYETFLPLAQAVIPKGDVPFEPALLPQPEVLAKHLYGVGLTSYRTERGIALQLVSPIGLLPTLLLGGGSDALQKLARQRAETVAGTQAPPPTVSYDFKGVTLASALDQLARDSGADIRFSRARCEQLMVSASGERRELGEAIASLLPAGLRHRLRRLPGGKLQVVIYPTEPR